MTVMFYAYFPFDKLYHVFAYTVGLYYYYTVGSYCRAYIYTNYKGLLYMYGLY